MSGVLLNKDDKKENTGDTLEKNILRRVVKESWRNGISDPRTRSQSLQALEEHATKMERILGTLDYDALCMPNIITNSRRMSRLELFAYLSSLEALAIGYRHSFDSDFASMVLAGLTLKARDLHALSRHFDFFIGNLERRLKYYVSKSERENEGLDAFMQELEQKESSILRFFRRGEINLLRRIIKGKARRAKFLSQRLDAYSGIILKVRSAKSRPTSP